jgi:hypothetical protein
MTSTRTDAEPPLLYSWLLLGALVALFVVQATAFDNAVTRFFEVTISSAALLIALQLGPARRRWRIAGAVLVGIGLTVALVGALTATDKAARLSSVSPSGLFTMCGILAVIGAVRRHPVIDLRTVLAALTIYIFIGISFAYIYRGLEANDPGTFQTSVGTIEATSLQYFSFITLTTVGFGDITAVTSFARTLVALEALFGQLYLVTVVSLVVGNLGRQRRRIREEAEPDKVPPDLPLDLPE